MLVCGLHYRAPMAIRNLGSRFIEGAARASLVGSAASLVDWAALVMLVELGHIPAQFASIPALLLGAIVQFIGCRYFVFDGRDGDLGKQVVGFAVAEAGTLFLNAVVFQLLISTVHAPYAMARVVGTFLVFNLFSRQAWREVFTARDANERISSERFSLPGG